jgi:hypothetical protein
MAVVEMTESAQARELRRLRQENADLRRTLEAVEYMRRETPAFRPEDHPMIAQAIATREALLTCRCQAA